MQTKQFGKIGVLAGGPSSERPISLKSGKAVYDALVAQGFDAVLIDVNEDIYHTIKSSDIDVAFIALHGRFGEDGTVQMILEGAGIPYTGSGVAASRMAIDKIAAKEIFIKNNIPVPKYAVIKNTLVEYPEVYALGFPVVVKPQFEGSSIGLSVVGSKEELAGAISKALRFGGNVLVEQFIEGRELTVGILSDKPLPVIEIAAKNKIYDFSAKYSDPDTEYIVPAKIGKEASEEAQDLAKRAHHALGCRGFSRVDMLMDGEGRFYVLELNTIPGMTERSLLPKAAGVKGLDFNGLCVKLLEEALGKDGKAKKE